MLNKEEIFAKARLIHYSTDLPVSVFTNKKPIYKIPEDIQSIEEILNNTLTVPSIIKTEEFQLIQSDYKELAIIINLINEHYVIAVGPFLNEKVEVGTITNMIRDNIIPFHQKTAIQKYYNSLLILNEGKIHYIGKLVQTLFNSSDIKINNSESIQEDKIEHESFIKQKSEYRHNIFLHSPYTIEQEISKTISNGNTKEAIRILNEINLAPHAKLAPNVLRSYKNSMICSCAFMTRAAIKGGVNPNEAFTMSDTMINEIEDFSSIEELQAFETKMVKAFSDKVKSTKALSYSTPIFNVIYYIDNHLCEDLNINLLAKEVFLNPSYLSNLFHKETGSTLIEWIQRKRIEESALFLINSNESVSDIAFFYKFSSQSYYVQCFKKIMGITPGEYRKKGKN